ncbi:Uncharacterized protein FWK35_00036841 [Aphis craccivora]|uniref:Uncharacterized protein n=1 Tax=Aphis craccivora TaxID=307492 RepID=A0A6G0VTP2_APHCR|nr:Uncharacterized protein FWK35_00036841 [Aphis craccivora]
MLRRLKASGVDGDLDVMENRCECGGFARHGPADLVTLNTVTTWFKKWKLNLNPTKNAANIFSLIQYKDPQPIQCNNQLIQWNNKDDSVKYLAIICLKAPRFIRNRQIHNDTVIPLIQDWIKIQFKNFHANLNTPDGARYYNTGNETKKRFLKPRQPQDLLLS